jgi:phenylacetate-CoA ligase
MSISVMQALYKNGPGWLQTAMLNAYAIKVHWERYGRYFEEVLDELTRTQYYSDAQIQQYQNERVSKLIKHSYETVPYYRELFDSLGLKPKDITTVQELEKLPVLTKDTVRNNVDRLISRNVRKNKLVHGHTSGTTGTPLDVYWDKNTCVYANAVYWRHKNLAGVRYRDPVALLLGRVVVPVGATKPPFWRKNYLHNHLWLSSFHMSPENLGFYVRKLEEFKPVVIEGYPSTVYILARYLLARRQSFPVRAVFTSSETLFPVQREAIEQAFCCKIFDYYGLAERVVFATECEVHSGHHLNFEFGATEVLDASGKRVAVGQSGVLVSTSLQNYGMPMIRYKTSDTTALIEKRCSCGRSMPLMQDVTTKAEDIIVRPDGRLISPSVLTHPFKPMHNIEKSQIIQDALHHITIKIVKREGYSDADTQTLLDGFQERVGSDVVVDVEFVDDIPRTSSGKYRWVISQVPRQW